MKNEQKKVVFNWSVMLTGWCSVICFSCNDTQTANSTFLRQVSQNETHLRNDGTGPTVDPNFQPSDAWVDTWSSRLRLLCCACCWESRDWNLRMFVFFFFVPKFYFVVFTHFRKTTLLCYFFF